ncbi:hypothetical protein [Nonomuraea sp. NEAU-A123]|uniref:hypothetical protein n=1 Tax=Nonomuraea sp. NEAU-A123 TaxID=2839649 RepID=UPI001BE44E3F|nr:hypothetical protein [Nonomuraea sp. NEAU-A123]MBT2225012.1 hypothetical protein [Nonomuraea sp. NEAU-A123]
MTAPPAAIRRQAAMTKTNAPPDAIPEDGDDMDPRKDEDLQSPRQRDTTVNEGDTPVKGPGSTRNLQQEPARGNAPDSVEKPTGRQAQRPTDPGVEAQDRRSTDSNAATAEAPVEPEPARAHAVPPQSPALFDQDLDQAHTRWRDLQATFVDDPREAMERADGLVEEIVITLTGSLTTRTSELRDRWKNADQSDTEQLRLALRDYKAMLEQLLAMSGPG